MNYCPHCGSDQLKREIPKDDHRLRTVCSNCSTIHYSNPLMVTGCLVLHEGKILLAKRGIEPRKGMWNLPCGFLENGEAVEDGAIREVMEETGIEVKIEKLHSIYSVLPAEQVYAIFKADAVNDKYTLTPESTEIQFFDPLEIPWEEIAFSANVHALQTYLDSPDFEGVHLGSYSHS